MRTIHSKYLSRYKTVNRNPFRVVFRVVEVFLFFPQRLTVNELPFATVNSLKKIAVLRGLLNTIIDDGRSMFRTSMQISAKHVLIS